MCLWLCLLWFSSSFREHAVLSLCLLCLSVTVTPGYFCCRGIYTLLPLSDFTAPSFPSIYLCLRPALSPSLTTAVPPCPPLSIYIYVSVCVSVHILCSGFVFMNSDVTVVCLCHVCLVLLSLTSKAGSGQSLVFVSASSDTLQTPNFSQ